MAINLMCPNLRCRKILAVPDNARGSRVRCAYCHQILLVPTAAEKIRIASAHLPAATVPPDKEDVKAGKGAPKK
jgi:LSD1 subclass zinc finger protein